MKFVKSLYYCDFLNNPKQNENKYFVKRSKFERSSPDF